MDVQALLASEDRTTLLSAGAVILIVVISSLMLMSRRLKKTQQRLNVAQVERGVVPPDRPQRQVRPAPVVLAASFNDPSGWAAPMGGAPRGAFKDGVCQLGPDVGVRSAKNLPAIAGRKYRLDYRAKSLADPKNGAEANFFAGPLFLDSEGEIVGWWVEQPPLHVSDGERAGVVEVLAPRQAATVHIGLSGSRSKEGPGADGLIAFVEARLSLPQD